MEDYSRLFVDSTEKKLAVLGGGYLQNYFATGTLDKGFCVISDKRVYFRGKCYYKVGNDFKSIKEERTVDLSDVTGTGFSQSKYLALKIVGIITLILAVISGIGAVADHANDFEELIFYFSGVLPAIADWVAYYFLKVKLFEVSYAGGKIAFKASNYNEQEMQEFQKTLRRAKDEYINSRNMQNAYVASAMQNMQTSIVRQNDDSASVADELVKYKGLLDSGVITQEEFEAMKRKMIG